MAFKFVVLAAVLAIANAGLLAGPATLGVPALGVSGLGVSGLGLSGLGVSGLGVSRLGVPGLGVSGLGVSGLGLSAVGVPALAAPALATPAITAQASNILRTPGNLGQISTYSKAIDTPYSSVRKSDVRVSNDALAYGAVAAPALAHTIAAPALAHTIAAPALAARAVGPAGLLGVAYSAAPAVAHVSFSGLGASYIL